jgi:hypothetical protein
MTIIEYGKLYTQFLKQDIPTDKEAELMATRTDFVKRGQEALIVAIEKCVEYDNFNDSIILKDFMTKAKWLLVEPNHKKLTEWLITIPQDHSRDNRDCLENLVIANLTIFVCDYIDTIYESLR